MTHSKCIKVCIWDWNGMEQDQKQVVYIVRQNIARPKVRRG